MQRLFILLLFFLTIISYKSHSAVSSYNVDITVDVTADNASIAREQAMHQANRQAVNNIAANITTTEGISVLDKLTDEQLLNFIKEITVLDEKTSNIRYMAKLRINVNAQLLKEYLQEKNVPLLIGISTNISIIPIFHDKNTPHVLLWEENNIWRKTWEKNPQTIGSMQITSIKYNDFPYLTINQALSAETEFFTNNNNTYVAEAFYNNQNDLLIKIRNLQTQKTDILNIGNLATDTLLEQAVKETARFISSQLQEFNIITSNEPEMITVLYKYNNLSSWLKIEEQIKAITSVTDIRLNAVGNGRVQFQIDYLGDINTLQKALNNKNLLLTSSGNYYTLTSK